MSATHAACAILAFTLLASASAHSYLSVPEPISTVETCRVGGTPGFRADCPGPCPNYDIREDSAPEHPTRTYKRGERVEIRWTKNNHRDGFMRLSMVPIDEMMSKDAHHRYAFYYGCWTDQEIDCNPYERHRDCYYDRENLGYKTQVTIPTIYPDGVYVFGWVWYGGGRVFGSFGDYYDCAYVEIKGGPTEDTFPATFESWQGWCMASVDRLGVCDTEPCRSENWSKRRIPAEFKNGAPTLYKSWYDGAMSRHENQIQVARHGDFGVNGFKIYDSKAESEMDVNQDWVIELDDDQEITIVPDTFGQITFVQWYVNGKHEYDSRHHPWAIAGSGRGRRSWNVYGWNYHYYDKRVFVTCIVHNGNRRAYYRKDLVFMPRNR